MTLRFDEEKFREQWNSGTPIPELAATFGASRSTIATWRKALGLAPRESGGQRGHTATAKVSPAVAERRERVRECHAQGMSNKEIVQALDLNPKSGYTVIATDLQALGLRRVGAQPERKPPPPRHTKPCRTCYSPMALNATGEYECIRHGVHVPDTWAA